MSDITKKALETALKHQLLKKPLDKITIRALTDDCGISRMAFYYHFQDIYDLVEWVCITDAREALAGKKTAATWSEGLLQIFEAVYENKPFVLNAYRALERTRMERFLFGLTETLIAGVVEEKTRGLSLANDDKEFIATFYTYSFIGLMLDWIAQGMDEDYHTLVKKISCLMKGAVSQAAHNFASQEQ